MNSILPFKSLTFYKETDKEYIYYCPFCDELHNSKSKHKHGHFYIDKKFGRFHCFKCNKSGNWITLSKYLNEECAIEFTSTIIYDIPYLDVSVILKNIEDLIEYNYYSITDIEKNYFKSRLGLSDLTLDDVKTFGILSDYYCRSTLYASDPIKYNILKHDTYRVWTSKIFGTSISGRSVIKDNAIRYINGEVYTPWNQYVSLDVYCIRSSSIQNYNNKKPPKSLVIAEGIYDIVNIYIKKKLFDFNDEKNMIFMAVQCSDYRRAIKMYQILYNCLPKNVIVFADSDRTTNMMRDMFKGIRIPITINWPLIKDWNPAKQIKCSLTL